MIVVTVRDVEGRIVEKLPCRSFAVVRSHGDGWASVWVHTHKEALQKAVELNRNINFWGPPAEILTAEEWHKQFYTKRFGYTFEFSEEEGEQP